MVLIRKALPSDSESLAQIQVNSYRSSYAEIMPEEYLANFTYEEQTQDWLAWMDAYPQDILLTAEVDNRDVVGYLLARPGETDVKPYDGEVKALHVRSAFQRQGVGRSLFIEGARQLYQEGCRSLVTWVLEKNLPARQFYERLGGKQVARREIDMDADEIQRFEIACGWLAVASLWA